MSDISSHLIEANDLKKILDQRNVLLVDMGSKEDYQKGHIAGSIHGEYTELTSGVAPATGKLPDAQSLSQTLSRLGLTEDKFVVAYDHENNAKACRLLWTLDVVSHGAWALLNGGFTAWVNNGQSIDHGTTLPAQSSYNISRLQNVSADVDYILSTLENSDTVILDARSPEEYAGLKSPSTRKGHIPGAVNVNWLDTIDMDNSRKLKSPDILSHMLESKGISSDKEIIVHCQTHHRSSHSYVMLKSLGFDKIRAYDGSWSEWGNRPDLPIETE